jgi:hypothetical protein
MDHMQLWRILETGGTKNPLHEILSLLQKIDPRINIDIVKETHRDIGDFFSGKDPNFKPCTTKYHDIKHTYGVALATVRLFHGFHCEHRTLHREIIVQGVLSAYFHDTGLLLKKTDPAQSGACYTKTHEKRSIALMGDYYADRGTDKNFMNHCALMITCTDLKISPLTLTFSSEDHLLAGCIVATADILAQMADRYYLERLPWLFEEMQLGGIKTFSSEMDLIQHTTSFYNQVIKQRLRTDLKDVQQEMRPHFKKRWGLDENLYLFNINQNINYLDQILAEGEMTLTNLFKYLKRTPLS